MHLKEGYKLHEGKYQLLNIIGEGGFSLTYKGTLKTEVQGALGRIPANIPVCIKEYFFKDYCLRSKSSFEVITNSVNGKEIFEKYKERVIKEARILSEVHHPNIVSVLEVFKQNNTVYIVMEFISGQSLKQILQEKGVFNESELIKIIYKIGQALNFIHEKNILHLDIKPSNILVNHFQYPILIDFGISKRYDLVDQQETSTTIQAISKGYASIEQYDNEGIQTFSPCPDIYSLGATMYYLLTGQVPTESILRTTKGLENPRMLNPELSENTEKVILKAMALNPEDRYQSVMDMITDLGFDPEIDKVTVRPLPAEDEDKTELLFSNDGIKDFSTTNEETVLTTGEKSTSSKNKVMLTIAGMLIVILIVVAYLHGNKELSFFWEKDNFVIQNESIAQTGNLYSLIQYKLPPQNQETINTAIATNPEQNNNTNSKVEITPVDESEKLFNEALVLYKQENYSSAKQKLIKAGKIKNTRKIEEYISLCNIGLEKEIIDKRKELYEIIRDYGNFVLVRKRSNGMLGVINKNTYQEVIECKYKALSRSGKNPSFLRSDDLYDIYTLEGTPVETGVSNY